MKGVLEYSEFRDAFWNRARDVDWNNNSDLTEVKLIRQAFLERNFPELQHDATPLRHEIIDHQFKRELNANRAPSNDNGREM